MEILILIIALLSTLLWLNILFAEHITAKVNPYITPEDIVQKQRAITKIMLIIIMSISWASYIYFYL
jgi:type II secretory pathway component PulC